MQIMSYLRPRGLICSFAKKSISWLEHTWWPGLKNTWWPKKTPGGLASFEPGVSSLPFFASLPGVFASLPFAPE